MKYDFELDVESENSLSIIIRQLKPNSTILEFGPANGRLTKYTKENLDCKTYLVELDEKAGNEALQYGVDLVVGDIEEYQWVEKYKNIKFNHIIFADVLEHLRNPLKVLMTAKEFLLEDGTILLSVPNLAHNSVLIDLLNNKFEYTKVGLLDDTHIHFFTKTSLDRMVDEAELFASKKMATYAKVGTIEIVNSLDDIESIKPSFWNGREYGNVYQYVYELSRKPIIADDCVKTVLEDDYWFQIYYDETGEWKEEKSIIHKVDISRYQQSFNIELPEKVKYVRIDPLNCDCIVSMIDICGKVENERIKLTKSHSNEECMISKLFCFTTNDPWISYELSSEVDKIEVQYEIIDAHLSKGMLKENGFKEVISNIEEINSERESLINSNNELVCKYNQIQDMNNSLVTEREALLQTVQYERERADILQAQRDRLESKKLYKIYKFFKRK